MISGAKDHTIKYNSTSHSACFLFLLINFALYPDLFIFQMEPPKEDVDMSFSSYVVDNFCIYYLHYKRPKGRLNFILILNLFFFGRFFDFTKTTAKRAFRVIQVCVSCHFNSWKDLFLDSFCYGFVMEFKSSLLTRPHFFLLSGYTQRPFCVFPPFWGFSFSR